MSAAAAATVPARAPGARWWRTASRLRRSAALTVRRPLPHAADLTQARARYRRIVISYRQPGTVLTDRFFAVPLDHGRPDGEQIEVFAREVVAADKADADLPVAAVPAGRARIRGAAAGRPGVLAGPGAR